MSLQFWSPVDPTETPVLTMDFSLLVAAQGGAAISSASIVVTTLWGTDPNPQALVQGVCDVSGSPKVRWRKAAGAGSADAYLVTITATLSGGQVLIGSLGLPIQSGGAQ